MLLTSAGLQNETLKSALADLLGKRFAAARIVFVPTASLATSGDHGWVIEDLNRLHGLGWREFNLLEFSGLPGPMVLDRLRRADVIYVEGGNHYHLANSMTGIAAEMADILESKVYVGVSAGSMVFSRKLSARTGETFSEQDDLQILGEAQAQARAPIGLFDWYLKPHLNSRSFPNRTEAWFKKAAGKLDFPVYAIDDDSAVRVRGDQVDVVSDGEWLLLNAPAPETGGHQAPKPRRFLGRR
jgi:dipeptidase E